MNKWIAEFDLEDGDSMLEHMDLNYMGAKIDFHCRPMWIPDSEKLPKPNELVDNVRKYYLIQDEYGDMCVARYTKKGWHPIESLFFLDDVVAWIPLPEPYKEGMENEE